MFSEPHEQELLWLKFNVEDEFISEWVIIEGGYTFQGKRKEKYLNLILSQPRFQKFIEKIHYIEFEDNYNFNYEPSFITLLKRKIKRWLNSNFGKSYDQVPYAELASFYAEINQRGAALDYLKSKYSHDDIVILCDADEIFDFNGEKGLELEGLLRTNSTPFYIRRDIYCYDFNNKTYRERFSPIVKLGDLKNIVSCHKVRHPSINSRRIVSSESRLAYEYTFCFSKDAILKKLTSFAHVTDLDERSVEFCLENNISFVNPTKIDCAFKMDDVNYYELISQEKLDSPKFLIDNFNQFRTGVVSLNYSDKRRISNIEYIDN